MKSVVVAAGEGRFIAVGSAGTGVTVKASAAETDGLCTVWEGRVPAGDELFYVLEGQLVLRIGEEQHSAGAGTFAFVPRGTIHGFHNASRESATLLVIHHPSGFEQFLEENATTGRTARQQGGARRVSRLAVAMRYEPSRQGYHRPLPDIAT